MVPEQSSDKKDEFELVPRAQLEYLRSEVERIKRNPFGDTRSSKDLLASMDSLNANVEKLVRIFETASDDIIRDYKDGANTEKINRMLDQNERLAKGIVAIAELVQETKESKSSSPPTQNPFTVDKEPKRDNSSFGMPPPPQ